MPTTTPPPTFIHSTREDCLLAAKRTIKALRYPMLNRRTDTPDDIIDVISGTTILERHICKLNNPVPPTPTAQSTSTTHFRVEELALYQ